MNTKHKPIDGGVWVNESMRLAQTAAKRLYERGLSASLIVRDLHKYGHPLSDVAFAVRHFPELDAMLFSQIWGGSEDEQRTARIKFLEWK